LKKIQAPQTFSTGKL